LFGTQEEALAAAQQRFGVRGGADQAAKLQADRIKRERDAIEAGNLDEAGLRRLLSSGNRDTAIAAGEILLGKGKLTLDEQKATADRYGQISTVARKEFQKRVTEQALKDASKIQFATYDDLLKSAEASGKSGDRRKFLEAAMRGEAGNRLKFTGKELNDLADLMDNDEDKRAFFESVTKSGRNKVAAIETMANRGMIIDRNGTKVSVDQALADRADSLSPDDLLDAEEYYNASGNNMSEAVARKYKEALKDRIKSARMLRNVSVSDPDQINRLYGDMQLEAAGVQKKEQTIDNLQKSSRKLATKAKEVRNQARHERNKVEKNRLEKLADKIEDRRDTVEKRIGQIKKS
jgi:hypothetical protein